MTKIQMGQFVLVMAYLLTLWIFDFQMSNTLAWYVIVNNVILLILFGNFYINAYSGRKHLNKST